MNLLAEKELSGMSNDELSDVMVEAMFAGDFALVQKGAAERAKREGRCTHLYRAIPTGRCIVCGHVMKPRD